MYIDIDPSQSQKGGICAMPCLLYASGFDLAFQLAQSESELAMLRATMERYRNVSNPLPPPPRDVTFHIPYTSHGGMNEDTRRARRHSPDGDRSVGGVIAAPSSSKSGRSKDQQKHKGPSSRRQEVPPYGNATAIIQPPPVDQNGPADPGIRPGAAPSQRVIPPTEQVVPVAQRPQNGKGKEVDRGPAPENYWDFSSNRHLGEGGNEIGLETSLAFMSGYSVGHDQARYAGGYAPNYRDGRYTRASPQQAEARSTPQLQGPGQGLGLEGVPEVRTGTVTRRASPFRMDNLTRALHDSSSPSLTLLQPTTRSAAAPTHTVADVLGPSMWERNRQGTGSPASSSWSTPREGQAPNRASLASLENLNNLSAVRLVPWGTVQENGNGEEQVEPRFPGASSNPMLSEVSLGDVHPLRDPPVASGSYHEHRASRESLSASGTHYENHENRHLSSSAIPPHFVPPRQGSADISRTPRLQRHRQHGRAGSMDHIPRPSHLSESTTFLPAPSPLSSSPPGSSSANALALTLGPSAATVQSPARVQATHMNGTIHAPAPRVNHNVLRDWSLP
jgi:hypothetical protein